MSPKGETWDKALAYWKTLYSDDECKFNKEINIKRTEEALETKPDIIAAGCPFSNTMLSDGIKNKKKTKEQVAPKYPLLFNAFFNLFCS